MHIYLESLFDARDQFIKKMCTFYEKMIFAQFMRDRERESQFLDFLMKTSTNHKFTSIFISLSGVIAATIVHAAATRIMSVCISLMHTFRSIFLFFCSFGICSRCILSLYHLVYQRHKYWMSFHEIEFCVRMCYRRHRRCTSTNIPYKYTFHVRTTYRG